MITKKKLSYEGPVCEVFEVQSEAVMQTASPTRFRLGGAGSYDYDNNDIYDNGDY